MLGAVFGPSETADELVKLLALFSIDLVCSPEARFREKNIPPARAALASLGGLVGSSPAKFQQKSGSPLQRKS